MINFLKLTNQNIKKKILQILILHSIKSFKFDQFFNNFLIFKPLKVFINPNQHERQKSNYIFHNSCNWSGERNSK